MTTTNPNISRENSDNGDDYLAQWHNLYGDNKEPSINFPEFLTPESPESVTVKSYEHKTPNSFKPEDMTEEEKEKEADRLANVLGSYGTVYDRYPHLRPKEKETSNDGFVNKEEEIIYWRKRAEDPTSSFEDSERAYEKLWQLKYPIGPSNDQEKQLCLKRLKNFVNTTDDPRAAAWATEKIYSIEHPGEITPQRDITDVILKKGLAKTSLAGLISFDKK